MTPEQIASLLPAWMRAFYVLEALNATAPHPKARR